MKIQIFVVIGIVCLLLPGSFVPLILSQDSRDPETGPEVDFIEKVGDEASMNYTKMVVRAKGNGFGPENVKELGRRKILAKRAAEMDAYRNLVEVIKGVRVTSYTTVEDMMLESDTVRTRTLGMLKGMQVKEVVYSQDGSCEVTVEVNINKDGNFLLAALNNGEIRVTDNYPKFDWIAQRKKLEKLKSQYALLLKDFKLKGQELNNAHLKMAQLEVKLKNHAFDRPQLKIILASAEHELINTRNKLAQVADRLQGDEAGFVADDMELGRIKKYIRDKEKELEVLSSAIAEYKNLSVEALLDQEKLISHIQQLKDIQLEIFKKFEHYYKKDVQTKKPVLKYTGLLVDARGVDLKPILAPFILNPKKEKVYGPGFIPANTDGASIVSYLPGTIEWAKKRKEVGDNPLVVKCIKVVKESDIMISDEDIQKMGSNRYLLEQKKFAILYKG